MRDKLIDMLWELNDHVYPDYDTKADEILSLFGVSYCEHTPDKSKIDNSTLEDVPCLKCGKMVCIAPL